MLKEFLGLSKKYSEFRNYMQKPPDKGRQDFLWKTPVVILATVSVLAGCGPFDDGSQPALTESIPVIPTDTKSQYEKDYQEVLDLFDISGIAYSQKELRVNGMTLNIVNTTELTVNEEKLKQVYDYYHNQNIFKPYINSYFGNRVDLDDQVDYEMEKGTIFIMADNLPIPERLINISKPQNNVSFTNLNISNKSFMTFIRLPLQNGLADPNLRQSMVIHTIAEACQTNSSLVYYQKIEKTTEIGETICGSVGSAVSGKMFGYTHAVYENWISETLPVTIEYLDGTKIEVVLFPFEEEMYDELLRESYLAIP